MNFWVLRNIISIKFIWFLPIFMAKKNFLLYSQSTIDLCLLSIAQLVLDKFTSDQIRSVAQSCPTLCNPMNRSTPGLPVHHQLPEFTQTHVHPVSDAIQPSHPLASPSPPAPIPPSIRVFSNESTLRMRWPKYWSFSFSIIPSKEHPGLISTGYYHSLIFTHLC